MDEKFSVALSGNVVMFRRMHRVNEYKARPAWVKRLAVLVNAEARAGKGTLTAFGDGWAYVVKREA